jgi:hypothetical protein
MESLKFWWKESILRGNVLSFETGGRVDKFGNRYEERWIVKQLLGLLYEEIQSVTIEPIGEIEAGVDLWIRNRDGEIEYQQCKARNANKDINKDFMMLQLEADVLGSVTVMDFGDPEVKDLPASKVIAIQHLGEDSGITNPNLVSDSARDRLQILTGSYNANVYLTSEDVATLIDHYDSVNPFIRKLNNWAWENQDVCTGILQIMSGLEIGAIGWDTGLGYSGVSTEVGGDEYADAEVGSGNSNNRVTSTGRVSATCLEEELFMQEVMSDPLYNASTTSVVMGDTRWPATDGWVKMQRISSGGINIHFLYNTMTGEFADFKFVN